jgi:hypothetical protein
MRFRPSWLIAAYILAFVSGQLDTPAAWGQDQGRRDEEGGIVCNDDSPQTKFYVRADSLFLDYGRAASGQPVVVRNDPNNSNQVVLRSSDAAVGIQYGPQITFGVHRSACVSWEFSYFGLFGGDGQSTALGNNNLALPGTLGLASIDFFNADRMQVDSSAEMHSFEINRLRHIDHWTVLAGFRYLRYTDSLRIESLDQGTDLAEYSLEAENHLFGMQGGLQYKNAVGLLGWHVGGKAGVFGNSASQLQFVTDFPNPNPPFFLRSPVEQTQGQAAFVGEVDLGLCYQVSPALRIRGGYRLLWIEGVTLSANQLDFRDVPISEIDMKSGGGMFLHGVTLGVEGSW